MPSKPDREGLSVILGLGPKGGGEGPPDDPKRLAAETLMDAVKEKDIDLFMSALDDYLSYREMPEE